MRAGSLKRHALQVLESPEEVWAFQANPHSPGLLAAGCHNGQVFLWDLSTLPVRP